MASAPEPTAADRPGHAALLFGTQLGGGTDINQAVTYCQRLITRPARTIFILVSDLYEGGDRDEMLRRMAAMTAAGTQVIVLLALSDDGAPGYDHENAAALAGLGVTAFACTPTPFPTRWPPPSSAATSPPGPRATSPPNLYEYAPFIRTAGTNECGALFTLSDRTSHSYECPPMRGGSVCATGQHLAPQGLLWPGHVTLV